jgi:HK97 family phage major capsid protein
MTVLELQAQHDNAIAKADRIVSTAERQKRNLNPNEQRDMDAALKEASDLKPRIAAAKSATPRSVGQLRAELDKMPRHTFALESRVPAPSEKYGKTALLPNRFSREYLESFDAFRSGVGPITGSLQEGASTGGGFAVPIVIDQKIVPLAPQDCALRSLATVVETAADVRIPAVLTRGTAAIKTETGAFPQNQPSLGDFVLSAFLVGNEIPASIELLQDVPWAVKEMILPDAESAQLEAEEAYYINGTGSGQAQGLIGNCGPGVTCEPDTGNNLVSVDAVWQVIASLKDRYAKNASFLMSRATALGIRRAQVGSGAYYEPIYRRENGVDLLAGYPLAFSASMPAATRGATPVLFGDFKRGYLIGDRGGSALFVKRLDQTPLMVNNGEISLFFYRRSDGRVRVAEAIQSLIIAAS